VSSPPATDPNRFAQELFDGLPDRYDRLAEVLSFGQNGRWRRFRVSRLDVGPGQRVLDVATGTAGVAIAIAAGTGARVVGLDQSPEMMAGGRRAAEDAGVPVSFVLGQGERLPFDHGAFDAVTFTYLLRYVDDPPATLRELARVLRPGGVLANLEFLVPSNPVWHAAWLLYTRVGLPVGGRLASREWQATGRFLGPSISGFYREHPLTEQGGWWRGAGISPVRYRPMSLGGGIVIWGTKRRDPEPADG
jgi:demethylmenaquinone methyltransferase/2-methoxy-6-polyprenyl-1,4-benzoquinol methylase